MHHSRGKSKNSKAAAQPRQKISYEKKVDPAEANKYALVAQDILKGIGGKDNVVSVSYCTTRLRFVVKNYNQVNEQAVKAAGATGILRPGKNACQVIVGTKVKSVYDELDKLLK